MSKTKEFTLEQFDRLFFLLQSKKDENNTVEKSSWVGANSTKIYKHEFLKIFEVYELWKYESKFS